MFWKAKVDTANNIPFRIPYVLSKEEITNPTEKPLYKSIKYINNPPIIVKESRKIIPTNFILEINEFKNKVFISVFSILIIFSLKL